jgi:hypothetical protein
MRIVAVLLTVVLAGAAVLAQQAVPPPPQPAPDKPAAANPPTASAPTAVQPAANPPAATGPTLEATLKYIQEKVNAQGKIVYVETVTDSVTGESVGENYPAAAADPVLRVSFAAQAARPPSPTYHGPAGGGPAPERSAETQVVAVDPVGGALSFQENGSDMVMKAGWGMVYPVMSDWTKTWPVYFKNIERLEVISATDYKHRLNPAMTYQDDPPYFELVIHLAAGKSVQRHILTTPSGRRARTVETDDSIQEFALHFRDEDAANRAAKAFVHAIELCGGGSAPELF